MYGLRGIPPCFSAKTLNFPEFVNSDHTYKPKSL